MAVTLSLAQLALAMAIVKSKPGNLDIQDYAKDFRRYITPLEDKLQQETRDRYLDGAAFWQQAYEKSEAEQSKLFDRVYELEQSNFALREKLGTKAEGEQDPKKRKAAGHRDDNPNRKQAKTHINPKQQGLCSLSSLLEDFEYLEEKNASFMRQFYSLQQVLQKRSTCYNIVLASSRLSRIATRDLSYWLSHEVRINIQSKATSTLQSKEPDFISILGCVGYACQLIYQALSKLSGMNNGFRDVGHIIYQQVCLFEAAMKVLQKQCKMTALEKKKNDPQMPRKQTKLQRARTTRTRPSTSSEHTKDEIAAETSRLLGGMVLSLNLSIKSHNELLEGFLYILITRVGQLLSLFVFRDLQLQPNLQASQRQLPLPHGLLETDLDEASFNGAQNESRLLVWLLERALAFLDTNSPKHTRSTKQRTPLSKVKDRLCATLMGAVFGSKDPNFEKSLLHPQVPDNTELNRLISVQVTEDNVPKWFTQEVWRLVGWEALMEKPAK
ncbi:hypothetical protein ASPZODRAFT_126974 [Penicilliopsis zonata CBS 506.65]|uniref:Uncharacterized protein n=1 Tax=Penicilliopsis zonata CBS 506.65 TaxID=1073090 RepID=A0A1L9SV53_9EURO|nr:hypothetical protein ASPZODRAFT_126974 [Penicilliopsis zonata CBS 506.65]OJJ50991.1 hypothetical protein ASPZODRAFT_126974 [Penicilliopsis zonata CBS 506.65]